MLHADTSAGEPDASEALTVKVWRGGPNGGRLQTFQIPTSTNQTVLDAITLIQRQREPSLAYRFSCRVGMCGSCAMTVNGVPRWTCRTLVSAVSHGGTLEIRPLRNLPIIRDLVTDMTPFFERWTTTTLPSGSAAADAAPGFEDRIVAPPVRAGTTAPNTHAFEGGSSSTRPAPGQAPPPALSQTTLDDPDRRAANEATECINCGVCYAACDVVAADGEYMGPAALNRAWAAWNDHRRPDHGAIEKAVVRTGGCHTCHTHGACAAACPIGLNPSSGIAGLKRETSRSALRGIWSLGLSFRGSSRTEEGHSR